jgi:hypothetical protein
MNTSAYVELAGIPGHSILMQECVTLRNRMTALCTMIQNLSMIICSIQELFNNCSLYEFLIILLSGDIIIKDIGIGICCK